MTRLLAEDPGDRAAFLSALRHSLGLSLGVMVALGFGRFAYALLLPAMRADLHWSYTTSGSLNTANAAGYLLGALLSAGLLRRRGARTVFLAGMLITATALLLTPLSSWVPWLLPIRTAAGLGGALSITAGGVLAAHAASGVAAARRGQVLSVYYAGGGLGILLSGLTLPELLAGYGAGVWRGCWLALGAASFAALLLAWRSLPPAAPLEAAVGAAPADPRPPIPWAALSAYACFALGYIAYMTFSVALLRAGGASPGLVGIFWSVLGLSSVLAPLVWGRLLNSARGGLPLAVLMACLALGAALPLLSPSPALLPPLSVLSAVLFGGTFLSVVAATTALVRHSSPPRSWSAGVARFTVVFAAFQTLGPLLTGLIADRAGGLQVGLGGSAGLLLLGALLAALQRGSDRAAA